MAPAPFGFEPVPAAAAPVTQHFDPATAAYLECQQHGGAASPPAPHFVSCMFYMFNRSLINAIYYSTIRRRTTGGQAMSRRPLRSRLAT
jgi:hypothetical protein